MKNIKKILSVIFIFIAFNLVFVNKSECKYTVTQTCTIIMKVENNNEKLFVNEMLEDEKQKSMSEILNHEEEQPAVSDTLDNTEEQQRIDEMSDTDEGQMFLGECLEDEKEEEAFISEKEEEYLSIGEILCKLPNSYCKKFTDCVIILSYNDLNSQNA